MLRLVGRIGICLLLTTIVAPVLRAQANERKLVLRVPPKYPEYLKIHDIGGVVRLMVEVTPKGTVRSVSPVGGNPILVEAAVDAVKQWKYAPADNSDNFEVKIDFIPHQ
jgi:TonB family protein